jgi:type I restriction enzyme M protein
MIASDVEGFRVVLSKFAQKRVGTLNQFYTRSSVGAILVEQLHDIQPAMVLDLGSGSGSLSSAAANRWPSARFITVDLDPASADLVNVAMSEVEHHHIVGDVLTPITERVPGFGDFDLAVCNPPFYRASWNDGYADILRGAELESVAKASDLTGELLFLSQNLRALRNGGTLGLIAPDSMFSARRHAPLRRALLQRHMVETVIQLPSNAFRDTDAFCMIAIIKKNAGPTKRVKLLQYDRKKGLSEPFFYEPDDGENRLDYDFQAHPQTKREGGVTLRQLGADIQRGSLNSVTVKLADYQTFHTTDYGDERLRFPDALPVDPERSLVIAEPGDILVARIDRHFYKKIALVEEGRAALTDCIYRVRLPQPVQKAVFEALRAPEGVASLKATSKGVSARLLGKADFLDLPLHDVGLLAAAKELLEERQGLSLLL